MEKVSVVVPTYLEERYIEKCLIKIRDQDWKGGRIEIIVSDSNSKDKTREIARRLADKVVNIKERGISRGRNAGFRASRGGIVIFVDADTYLDRSFVKNVVKEFDDENVVGVSPNVLPYDGDIMGRIVHNNVFSMVRFFTLLGRPMFPLCFAYRRDALEEVNGFNEDVIVGEDLDLSLRVSKLGKCVCAKDALAYTSLRRFQKSGLGKSVFFQLRCYFKLLLLRQLPDVDVYPHTEEISSKANGPKARRKLWILGELSDIFSIGKNSA